MKDILAFCFTGFYSFLTDSNFRTFTRLIFSKALTKRYTQQTVSFNGFKIKVADVKSFIYQYLEIFVYRFYEFNSSTASPVIYDCGSNVGTSLLFFSNLYPNAKIVAFEPSATIFNLLQQNMKGNNIKNATLHQQAVWIKNETLEFNDEGADGGSVYSISKGNKIQVQAVDFLEILKKESKIDFLKIDIEGAESDLIPHIAPALDRVENIFIEYHSFNGKEQTLDKILTVLSQQHFRYFIRHSLDRKRPFVNKKQEMDMDMQLNIFAYKK